MKDFTAAEWQPASITDWALVQECARGDETACARLVNDHQRMVFHLALRLLGDNQEALDLSQDVFLRVFRTLPQFRGQSSLKTWIYRIVITQASNRQRWWRRRFRSRQVALDDVMTSRGELAEARRSASPEQVFSQGETAARVDAALRALPMDQRAAIVLREIDGLTYEEIGAALGVAVGTVKSRLARARVALRAELGSASEARRAL